MFLKKTVDFSWELSETVCKYNRLFYAEDTYIFSRDTYMILRNVCMHSNRILFEGGADV